MATPSKFLRLSTRGRPRDRSLVTFDGAALRRLLAAERAERDVDTTWPAGVGTRYYDRPDLYAAEVLGLKLLEHQIEVLMAVVRRSFVAVSSGRKIGKSLIAVIITLWWYCTRSTALVLMTATAAHQVDRVLWRELRIRVERAAIQIDGQLNLRACNGLTSGFRVVQGFSVSDREAAAGTSGTEIVYIVDEASGVPDPIFETLEGNMAAGGCKLFAISNPTQNEGWHFKAFHPTGVVRQASARHLIHERSDMETFCISSRDVAEKDKGRTKGIATIAWCDRQLERHGIDSAEYVVHVLGRHAAQDEGRAMSLALVTSAKVRWYDMEVDELAPLTLGLDPAGATPTSDLTCFSIRRGALVIEIVPLDRGSDRDAIIAELRRLLAKHRVYPTELAYLVFDVGGDVGARLLPMLREIEAELRFHLVPVQSSDVAVRHLAATKRRSAELVWNVRSFMQSGGAIPDDPKLFEECRAWEFKREHHDDERVKVDKNEVRKRLGRSPDRFDAMALSCWDVTDIEVRRARPKPAAAFNPGARPPIGGASGGRSGGSRSYSSADRGGLDPFSPRARRV